MKATQVMSALDAVGVGLARPEVDEHPIALAEGNARPPA